MICKDCGSHYEQWRDRDGNCHSSPLDYCKECWEFWNQDPEEEHV
jgi:hypothetical protein